MPTKRLSRAHYFAHGAFVHWFSFGHNADRDVSVRDGTHQTVVLPNRSNSTIVIPHRRGRSSIESSGQTTSRLCSSFQQLASLFSYLSSPPCSRSVAAESGYAASPAVTPLANGTRMILAPNRGLRQK
jgi:hypothetical protein